MEIVDRSVPVAEIGKTVGPLPSSRFVRSVRRHGVIVPVLLEERFRDDGTIQYNIIDGNRRVAAARRAKCVAVPARIMQGISPDEAARVTLATNSYRCSNYVTEFWAIKHLERVGVRRDIISQDADMSDSMLATRDLLSKLDRTIFVGFVEGKIPPTTALAVARLPRDAQGELGRRFASAGRLLKREVDTVTPWRMSPPESGPDIAQVSTPSYPHRVNEMTQSEATPPSISTSLIHTPEPVSSYHPSEEPPYGIFMSIQGVQNVAAPSPGKVVSVSAGTSSAPNNATNAALTTMHPAVAGRDNAGEAASASWTSPDASPHVREGSVPGHIVGTLTAPQLHQHSSRGNDHVGERCVGLSHDLRIALCSVARQAGNQGVDEETWLIAARDAYLDNVMHR